jgi:hypothetical protein
VQKFSEILADELWKRNKDAQWLAAEMSGRGVKTSEITVKRWVAGAGKPSWKRARVLADILGMTLDELNPTTNTRGE